MEPGPRARRIAPVQAYYLKALLTGRPQKLSGSGTRNSHSTVAAVVSADPLARFKKMPDLAKYGK